MGFRRLFRPRFRPLLVLVPFAVAAACAADPGDDPKGDGSSSLTDEAGSASGSSSGSVGSSGSGTGTGSGSGSSGSSTSPPLNDAAASGVASDDGMTDNADVYVAPPPSCPDCPLQVAYFTADSASSAHSAQQVNFQINIINNGMMPQALSELIVRYWFTADGATSLSAKSYYAKIGMTTLTPTVKSLTATTTPAAMATADAYVEISFLASAGSIAPQSDTGQIQMSFIDTTFVTHFNEYNDYSFNANDTSVNCNARDMNNAPSCLTQTITLYRGGKLVWGTEPGGTIPAGDP